MPRGGSNRRGEAHGESDEGLARRSGTGGVPTVKPRINDGLFEGTPPGSCVLPAGFSFDGKQHPTQAMNAGYREVGPWTLLPEEQHVSPPARRALAMTAFRRLGKRLNRSALRGAWVG